MSDYSTLSPMSLHHNHHSRSLKPTLCAYHALSSRLKLKATRPGWKAHVFSDRQRTVDGPSRPVPEGTRSRRRKSLQLGSQEAEFSTVPTLANGPSSPESPISLPNHFYGTSQSLAKSRQCPDSREGSDDSTPDVIPRTASQIRAEPDEVACFEALLWRYTDKHFKTETEAYMHVGDLQGVLIPRFYAAVRVSTSKKDTGGPDKCLRGGSGRHGAVWTLLSLPVWLDFDRLVREDGHD
ncbi:unnamed protein product [Fusarium fujikuroi]|uniref:Uncharacterized protein n=1 Tax=Fusarium fujikuroi TaxID=5127 RepID=A0A9Q9UCF2_FUSFU|nr:unnamed protein product [Fusarium fujikuroi]